MIALLNVIPLALMTLSRTMASRLRRAPTSTDEIDAETAQQDFDEITAYANGVRRVLLVDEHATTRSAWHDEVDTIEHALDHALRTAGSPATARDLRHHGGHRDQVHLLCWEIPGPHGPRTLDALRRALGLADDALHARIGTRTGIIFER